MGHELWMEVIQCLYFNDRYMKSNAYQIAQAECSIEICSRLGSHYSK